jgi:hypothetical protein
VGLKLGLSGIKTGIEWDLNIDGNGTHHTSVVGIGIFTFLEHEVLFFVFCLFI